MNRRSFVRRGVVAVLGLSMSLGAVAMAAENPPAKPYPLKTCIVSDEELGSMGDPVVLVHEGQEIKFCCKSCIKKFKADPAKYLKKLENPPKPATQPS
jgi:hypothetical protein